MHSRLVPQGPRRFSWRTAIARLLIVTQVTSVLPVGVAGAQQAPAPTDTIARGDAPPAAPVVKVNRTVPRVAPPPSAPSFTADPTDLEFRRVRIFAEALVPVGRPTRPDENRALASALMAYVADNDTEAVSGLLDVLLRYPDSPWRASLLANVGTVFSRTGYYSRALRSWDEAWRLAKDATDNNGRAVADYALGQWFDLVTRLGQSNLLAARLDEIKGREVRGAAAEKVTVGREGHWILTNRHHDAVASASVALGSLLASLNKSTAASAKALTEHHPGANGTSLAAVQRLARTVGFAGRMAYRTKDAEPVAPSILHLNVGHYAALVKIEGGLYLVRDAILGDRWISRKALDDEQSGYFLIPEGRLPEGWRPVEEKEASVVIGHCHPGAPDGMDPGGPEDECGSAGMPTYHFHPVTAALRLHDTPVGYIAPHGPAVSFSVNYNHRNTLLPQVPQFSHLGPQWEFDWLSYVEESTGGACGLYGCTAPQVTVNLRGFGAEEYAGAPDYTTDFGIHWRSRARLVRTSLEPIRYERHLPDGTIEVFELSDGAPVRQRRVFLTELIDPQGHHVELTYDSSLRLVAIADAAGQVSTIDYESANDLLLITKVTDPFGRFATFTYNQEGQLESITDVIGLTSSFTYGTADFISAMTTPYGTTTFRHESGVSPYPRVIEATDPMGGTERLEFHDTATALSATVSASEVPTGFSTHDVDMNKFVSLAWDKRAMALYPGDPAKATVVKWLLNRPVQAFLPFLHNSSSIPHSVKQPLEAREWYTYPNQTSVGTAGDGTRATKAARVLDDGTSQVWQASYNTLGHMTSQTDPLGREKSYSYAANNIDLLEVRQTTGPLNDLLASFSNYTAQHRPQTITDAAGQSTTLTFNSSGDVLTRTNAKGETTTYTYNVVTGMLQSVTGPVSGATTSVTYDAYGRIATVTDADSYTRTYQYDTFDRVTRVTYPDTSYDHLIYNRLDVSEIRDRLGRSTHFAYDPERRLAAKRDPQGRVTSYSWCGCGSLDATVDAKGQKTTWERDVQGRVTREVRDSVDTEYTYEANTSRLKTRTDPKLQVSTYVYNLDDTIQSVAYTNASIVTPSVSYTYDTSYKRVATRTDGSGTTTYTYHPVGSLGARQIATLDGPLANDTLAYTYDQLGRSTSAAVDSVAATLTYDTLGRVDTETNVLGTFTYAYDATSHRLSSVTYPSGQTTTAAYFNNNGDRHLQTLLHQKPGGATLSRFGYTYDKVGNVLSWQQQADSDAATRWQYGYDAADQLVSAVLSSTGTTPTVLKRFGYAYDPAGNRTTEQVDDTAREATYDSRNRLIQHRPGGTLRITGALNEPATVTIQGRAAAVDATNAFAGSFAQGAGTTTFAVQATDPSGNSSTATFEVDAIGSTTSFTFDANGNLTSDGSKTYEWDAADRLVAVNNGTHRSELSYDALYRRVRIVEKDDGVTTRDARLIWSAGAIVEERLSTGEITRFFSYGEQHNGTARYLTLDHLGSVREVTDATGAVITRNDYDPYGRMTRVAGTEDSRFGYTGHMVHAPTGLVLAQYRAYDADLGRWLNEDPAGMTDGPNRFAYVANRSISAYDPDGLAVVIVIVIPPIIEFGIWAAATYGAIKTGEVIADAIKKSQDETGRGGPKPWETPDEARREDKMDKARNPPKRSPRDYPVNDDPFDTLDDVTKAKKDWDDADIGQMDRIQKAIDRAINAAKRPKPDPDPEEPDSNNNGMVMPPGSDRQGRGGVWRCR